MAASSAPSLDITSEATCNTCGSSWHCRSFGPCGTNRGSRTAPHHMASCALQVEATAVSRRLPCFDEATKEPVAVAQRRCKFEQILKITANRTFNSIVLKTDLYSADVPLPHCLTYCSIFNNNCEHALAVRNPAIERNTSGDQKGRDHDPKTQYVAPIGERL